MNDLPDDISQEGVENAETACPAFPPEIIPAPPAELPPRVPPDNYRGFAVASLILGLCGVCLSIFAIGLFPAVVGLILGILYLRRSAGPKPVAVIGTLFSGCAMVIGACAVVFLAIGFMYIKDMSADMMANMDQDFTDWHGVPAPDFEVTTIDGKTVRLSDLKGKRVVLDCFAIWCPPCHMLSKNLDKLAAENPQVMVLSLADETAQALRDGWPGKECKYAVASASGLPAPYGSISAYPTLFFIDSNGVLQDSAVGYMEYAELLSKATAPDHTGPVLEPPKTVPDTVADAPVTMKPVPVWEKPVAGAKAVCAGDWNGDGADDLVVLGSGRLSCFDAAGNVLAEAPVDGAADRVRLGHCQGEPRLALVNRWDAIDVVDRSGKKLWRYKTWFGCDDGRWVDVDGAGNDSLLTGMNGFSGLHLVSPEGRKRWSNSAGGNCWTQAAVRTSRGEVHLYTSSAMGSIARYSSEGKRINRFQPDGFYFSPIATDEIDGEGTVQVLGWGSNQASGGQSAGGTVVAMTPEGRVLWKCPAGDPLHAMDRDKMVAGDLDGDGRREWTVPGTGDMLVVTSEGLVLSHTGFTRGAPAIVERPGGRGLLVIAAADKVTAFELQPSSSATETPAAPEDTNREAGMP